MNINMDDVTLGQIKELQSLLSNSTTKLEGNDIETTFIIGNKYLIRTVTFIQIGRLVGFNKQELQLEDACWVADTGRFSKCLSEGELNEVEMIPSQIKPIIGRGSIVDAYDWMHDLPTKTK